MDNSQKAMIEQIFNRKKTETEAAVSAIYKDIVKNVMSQPPEMLAQAILQMESGLVNEYIRNLRQELRDEAVKAMIACGISSGTTGIVWANVMNKAGLPKASLCRKENVNIPSNQSEPGKNAEKNTEDLGRLKLERNISVGVAAAGLAAGAVTFLVVPGWSGAVGIAKATEVILVVAGVVNATYTQKKIVEIDRICSQVHNAAPSQDEIRELVKQVCAHQYRTNTKIIYQWLDSVREELIRQCEIELAK